MLIDSLDELVTQLENGQALPLLLDGPHIAVAKSGRLTHGLCLPLWRLVACQSDAPELLKNTGDGKLIKSSWLILDRPCHMKCIFNRVFFFSFLAPCGFPNQCSAIAKISHFDSQA